MYWYVICDCVISLIILTHILGKVLLCTFCFDQFFDVAVRQQLCKLIVNLGGTVINIHRNVLFQKNNTLCCISNFKMIIVLILSCFVYCIPVIGVL